MWTKTKNLRGFTLIEILLVVTIIGLLSTLVVAALNNAKQQSRDSRRLADINKIQQALELYHLDKSEFPAGDGVVLGSTNYKCLNPSGWQVDGCANPYMDNVPANPGPGGIDYIYTRNPANVSDFQIDFALETGVAGQLAGLCCGRAAALILCPCP